MLTLPLYDLPTRSASGFLIRYVLPRSKPPQLIGPLDRKAAFSTLTVGDCIIGVGHGAPDLFAGHNDQILMTANSIPNVRGKIVVLVSCETAQVLGPALINAGAQGFIGFREDFVWVVDADMLHQPWADAFARPAMMPVVDCVNSLLDGMAVSQAFDVLKNELQRNIEREESDLVKSSLTHDWKNAVLLGNPGARVRPTPKIMLPIPPPPIIFPARY